MWKPELFADKPGGAGLYLVSCLDLTAFLENDSHTEWDPFYTLGASLMGHCFSQEAVQVCLG